MFFSVCLFVSYQNLKFSFSLFDGGTFFFEFYLFFKQQVLISYPHISVYMSIPISQFIPPTPPPPPLSPIGVHTFVLYICVSVSALQTGSSMPFFYIPHICINIRYLFFSLWLTSLCMTVSTSTHVSTNDPVLFLFMAE